MKLKAASDHRGITISEKTAEYLLFLLKSSKMWPEIIDLSENYSKLTGRASDTPSDIKNYYISDALIQMPLSKGGNYYYKLV